MDLIFVAILFGISAFFYSLGLDALHTFAAVAAVGLTILIVTRKDDNL